MTTKATISEIASRLMDPIAGGSTLMAVQVDADHYELSEFGGQSDGSQTVSSAHIVTGLCGWATRVLYDTSADAEDRRIAVAVGEANWTVAEELLKRSSGDAGCEIWDDICQVGVECDDVRDAARTDADHVNPVDDPQAYNEMPAAD